MSKGKYSFEEIKSNFFHLYHGTSLLGGFSRSSLRKDLECIATQWDRSSQWIGSVLRLFHKRFPVKHIKPQRSDLDRVIAWLGPEGIANYFRSRGFRVVKKLNINDDLLINYLESIGYELDGLLDGDVPYSSGERAAYSSTARKSHLRDL